MSKNNVLTSYPINIWDDYYEEGFIPEGKIQETYIYVEDSKIPHEKCKACLEKLLEYMNNNLNLEGVKLFMKFYDSKVKYPDLPKEYSAFHFERWEIRVENLTHKRRYKLVEELNKSNLTFEECPLEIYSES